MKFNDIKKFTQSPNYTIHVDWKSLDSQFELWDERYSEGGKIHGGLNLDPDYQREHVWSEEQQRAYVEFILKDGTSGRDLLFNCIGWDTSKYQAVELVDGKQRLNAVRKFLKNELTIFGGHKYSDFEDRLPRQAYFVVKVNNLKSKKEVMQWYIDLNTGGTIHTNEEIEKVKKLIETT